MRMSLWYCLVGLFRSSSQYVPRLTTLCCVDILTRGRVRRFVSFSEQMMMFFLITCCLRLLVDPGEWTWLISIRLKMPKYYSEIKYEHYTKSSVLFGVVRVLERWRFTVTQPPVKLVSHFSEANKWFAVNHNHHYIMSIPCLSLPHKTDIMSMHFYSSTGAFNT